MAASSRSDETRGGAGTSVATAIIASLLGGRLTRRLVVMSASVAGGVIAFDQLGYGIAAFGAGPLQDAGIGLPALYGFTAVAAVVMAGCPLSWPPGNPRHHSLPGDEEIRLPNWVSSITCFIRSG